MLETFYIDVTVTSTEAVATPNVFLNWAKTVLFEVDSDSGCNKSTTKQYFQVNNQKLGGIHCVSVKILSNKEIYSPNFTSERLSVKRVNMKLRKTFLKNFIEENNLKVQHQMLRSEHFFWNKKKLVYVFLTDLTSDNITDEQIENFIINAVDMHKDFENDLKLEPKKKIDFSKLLTAEEEEPKAKTEKKKSKSKVKAEATESRDIIKQLKELKKLYDDGILTKEQFEKAKDVLLSQNN